MCFSSCVAIEVKGKDLDHLAFNFGFKRRRYFWIFKESDRSLRERISGFFKERK